MDATLRFLTTIAGIVDGISLDAALRLVEASNDYRSNTVDPLTTHEGRMQFGRELVAVTDNIQSDRKIAAIRELRDALRLKGYQPGLREVKDAVDALVPEFPLYAWVQPRY